MLVRNRLFLSIVLFCLPLFPVVGNVNSSRADTPNVVFIYIDDLGYSDVGFLGARHYRTPHIDQLASEGMIFSNAYAAAPNCAPSRACLMSGQYTPRHGVYTVSNSDRGKAEFRKLIPVKNSTVLPAERVTVGELFQSTGYQTGYFGKWHLGSPGSTGPSEQGFDVNVGGNTTGTPRGGHFSPYKNPQLSDPDQKEYLTDRLGDEAVRFIRKHRDQPFLVFLSHYAVHTPVQAKPEMVDTYREAAGTHGFNAKYAAMVESVDDSVGRIMRELKTLDLDRKTMVIFYSDNGGHGKITSCAPLRGSKGMCYEGGIRVPLAIRWVDNIAADSRCDVPVHGVDFFATFQTMLDADVPGDQPMDGTDLLPLCRGESDTLERSLFWHFPAYLQGKDYSGAPDKHFRARPFGIVRDGDWKLIEHFEDNRFELFNLAEDIGETTDVAEQHPDVTRRLASQLKNWRIKTDAPVPTERNPKYRPGN